MKIKLRYIPLVILGGLIVWIKYPSEYAGLGEIFYFGLTVIYIIYLSVLLLISIYNLYKHTVNFDFVPIIISGFIISILIGIYIADDVNRLPIYMKVSGDYANNK